ncbi:hypothetical protein AGMMS49593_02130 [Endomicrobiia bacterium]|nr:hypothetical protein AGMMS49593_02130 [Endomicrobiia bacterium]
MKTLKNNLNVHLNKKTSDKEFDQLLYTLEERHEFDCVIDICVGNGKGACGWYYHG